MVVAKEGADRPPEGVGSVVAFLNDLHRRQRDRGVIPRDDGVVVERPSEEAWLGGR
jgi:hypothetical protein